MSTPANQYPVHDDDNDVAIAKTHRLAHRVKAGFDAAAALIRYIEGMRRAHNPSVIH